MAQRAWVQRDKILKQMAVSFENAIRKYLTKELSITATKDAIRKAIKEAGEQVLKEAVSEASRKALKESVEAIGRQIIKQMSRQVFKNGLRALASWQDTPIIPGPVDIAFGAYDAYSSPYAREGDSFGAELAKVGGFIIGGWSPTPGDKSGFVFGPRVDYTIEQYLSGVTLFFLFPEERPYHIQIRMKELLEELKLENEP